MVCGAEAFGVAAALVAVAAAQWEMRLIVAESHRSDMISGLT